jgi:carbamoyl-phosphate synthase large subunit
MIDRTGMTLLKVAGVCAGAAVGFVLFQSLMRSFETRAAIHVLELFGVHSVYGVAPTAVLVVPRHHAAFDVLITPSCSSLASVLALGCLMPLTPRRSLGRGALGVGTAAALIASGNVLRIAGSIAVGLLAGRLSLVLFHDWVGSVFTFMYTTFGYIFMLAVLLPRRASPHALTGESRDLVLDAV